MDQIKNKRVWIISAAIVCALIVVGLVVGVVVLAANVHQIKSAIQIGYKADGVYGTAKAQYKLGASGEWVDMKTSSNTTMLDYSNGQSINESLSPESNLVLSEENNYVLLKYTFTNASDSWENDYVAKLTYTDTNDDDKNVLVQYGLTETDLATANAPFYVYSSETEGTTETTEYYVKISIESLAYNATFTGSFNWNLTKIPTDDVTYTYNDETLTATVANKTVATDDTIYIPRYTKQNDKVYTVTSIGEYALGYYYQNDKSTSLKYVVIPRTITSIGNNAFTGCDSLKSITIPSSVTSIGISAFSDCRSLTSVTIPSSVTSIGERVFYCCSSLTSVTIPSSVTSIGERAFYYCIGLTSVTIPSSVTSIGERAFSACSGLISIKVENGNTKYTSRNASGTECNAIIEISTRNLVHGFKISTIPNDGSVTSIGDSAFRSCSDLTSVTIPNSVTSIGFCAFTGCDSLKSITIPSSVTSIGQSAFEGCSGLTSVRIEGDTPKNGGYNMFRDCPLTNIYVKAELVEQYKTATNWIAYASLITAMPA